MRSLVRVAADIARYEDGDDSPWGQPPGKDHKRAYSTPSIWCRPHPVAVHLSCAFSFRTSDPLESSFVRERSAPPSLTVSVPCRFHRDGHILCHSFSAELTSTGSGASFPKSSLATNFVRNYCYCPKVTRYGSGASLSQAMSECYAGIQSAPDARRLLGQD